MFTTLEYDEIDLEEQPQAERLAQILNDLYAPESVADVGCASGLYLKPFDDQGISVIGYEISPYAKEVAVIDPGSIVLKDITDPDVGMIWWADLLICLEVMEHIEKAGAKQGIDNICLNSPTTIVFSAAIPGQGGEGHVNLQYKPYWQEMFEANGYKRNEGHERIIIDFMRGGYHLGWLTQNLMIFQK